MLGWVWLAWQIHAVKVCRETAPFRAFGIRTLEGEPLRTCEDNKAKRAMLEAGQEVEKLQEPLLILAESVLLSIHARLLEEGLDRLVLWAAVKELNVN